MIISIVWIILLKVKPYFHFHLCFKSFIQITTLSCWPFPARRLTFFPLLRAEEGTLQGSKKIPWGRLHWSIVPAPWTNSYFPQSVLGFVRCLDLQVLLSFSSLTWLGSFFAHQLLFIPSPWSFWTFFALQAFFPMFFWIFYCVFLLNGEDWQFAAFFWSSLACLVFAPSQTSLFPPAQPILFFPRRSSYRFCSGTPNFSKYLGCYNFLHSVEREGGDLSVLKGQMYKFDFTTDALFFLSHSHYPGAF